MQRKMIFRDTGTNEEWVMPVTPAGYEIEHGRQIIGMTMQAVGSVNLPGPAVLLDQELEFLLPARDYPFNQPGTNLNPFVYLERLEKWSDAGTVLRFIVSDTPVNAAVLLGPIRYREKDGTNDIYCTVPIKGYRSLTAETVEVDENTSRVVEAEPAHQKTYTVAKGDTLSGICRRIYGDASLYGRLAAANDIKNPDLIYPGQVLILPEKNQLPNAERVSRARRAVEQTNISYQEESRPLQNPWYMATTFGVGMPDRPEFENPIYMSAIFGVSR